MKNLLNKTSSLLALLALGSLIALFALSLRQETSSQPAAGQSQSGGYPGPQRFGAESTIEPYPDPATSEPEQFVSAASTPLAQIVEEPDTPFQLPTPLPDRGVRVSVATEVALEGTEGLAAEPNIEGLFTPDLDGNLLVAKAKSANDIFLMVIDLQTRSIKYSIPITSFSSGNPRVLGKYVAWIERSSSGATQLQLLDVETGLRRTIWQGRLRQLDMKDGVLVWQEYGEPRTGLYGYDLSTEKGFEIYQGVKGKASIEPRICSKEWVIYMNFADLPEPGQVESADIYARNLYTSETVLIGQVPLVDSPTTGRSHDCDGNQIAWASYSNDLQTGAQHIYDLKERTERILDIPLRGWGTRVVFDGDILLSGGVGYDLDRNVPFSHWSDDIPIEQRGQMLLSDNRLAWIAQPHDPVQGSWHLYTAVIIQDE